MAIISGIVALGSAITSFFSTSAAADAQHYITDAQRHVAEINADVTIYTSDMSAVSQQYENQFALELEEYKNAGFQTGALTIGIIVVAIIYVMKINKKG
ncbi:MAG: hypothetical protein LBD91_08445 [Prevotellaceae bacterium]|nr:hypothetical protein [Prevotellaceae bacterium]